MEIKKWGAALFVGLNKMLPNSDCYTFDYYGIVLRNVAKNKTYHLTCYDDIVYKVTGGWAKIEMKWPKLMDEDDNPVDIPFEECNDLIISKDFSLSVLKDGVPVADAVGICILKLESEGETKYIIGLCRQEEQ